jgi:hypothetical protein
MGQAGSAARYGSAGARRLYNVSITGRADLCCDYARCERVRIVVRECVCLRGGFSAAHLVPHGTEAAADERVER